MTSPPPGATTAPRTAARGRRPGRTRSPRTARSVLATVGRVLLGLLVAVLLAGAVLVILAFYGDMKFDVEEAALAIVGAGLVVFLWTRWR